MTHTKDDKSRTAIKKEAIELQKTGEKLIALTYQQLSGMDIQDELKQAILDLKKITSFKAIQRQKQYIGAIMRKTDTEPILLALRKIEDGISLKPLKTKEPDTAKQWFNQLLGGNKQTENEIIESCPDTDRQRLRQLIRNAQKNNSTNKKSSTRLLNYLKELSS